eukprot:CAMPEP_0174355276 /NCGR_PEP_ID=MMETSP0811_2-20130205/23677_1 /TAXON_ID=73025 ORGANISM="Eutreptiella gymnastica-like, Strain CCMP1594" /NCGR_SAMPLE_ID=MMETSP0811_2 /ASSEMBLY_ACC=CAM_ASM_000667 /LENGTH=167 /DNA_ID=CAMNT_0015486539 /DNA_START=121 /DNA_END=621 /DNA_ORIENTATION=+
MPLNAADQSEGVHVSGHDEGLRPAKTKPAPGFGLRRDGVRVGLLAPVVLERDEEPSRSDTLRGAPPQAATALGRCAGVYPDAQWPNSPLRCCGLRDAHGLRQNLGVSSMQFRDLRWCCVTAHIAVWAFALGMGHATDGEPDLPPARQQLVGRECHKETIEFLGGKGG